MAMAKIDKNTFTDTYGTAEILSVTPQTVKNGDIKIVGRNLSRLVAAIGMI